MTRRAAAEPLALAVARECPADPGEIIAGYQRALAKAMKPRADGSRHLDSCRNARVNSQMFRCQDGCTDAQVLLFWGPLWLSRNVVPKPSQPDLWADEAPGPTRGMGRVG